MYATLCVHSSRREKKLTSAAALIRQPQETFATQLDRSIKNMCDWRVQNQKASKKLAYKAKVINIENGGATPRLEIDIPVSHVTCQTG